MIDNSIDPQNAFSDRLATFGFNLFPIFVVDLLHEVEIGVWRSLFIHLLRIMECIGPTIVHKLDERFVSKQKFPIQGLILFIAIGKFLRLGEIPFENSQETVQN